MTCPACKCRHRAHTKQAGCRSYEETKVDDENLKETPKDATMTASSPAATDEELGRSAKKAKIAAADLKEIRTVGNDAGKSAETGDESFGRRFDFGNVRRFKGPG